MKHLIDRWHSELPIFWKKVRTLAVSGTIAATAVFAANGSMGLGLDEVVLTVCKYTIVAGIVLGLSAQMTKKDNDEN